jgi:hypothetical protein
MGRQPVKLTPWHIALGLGLSAAAAMAFGATRGVGSVKGMTKFTESRGGGLQEHLVTKEELGLVPAEPQMHYPAQVAPGLNMLITQGFAPLYQIPDPQIAALPAEQAW